ncbi:MAG: alpha/beta hydrolase [Dehalococcoidia bacterium]
MPDEKRVSIRDGLYEIRYFTAGQGEPLLFLHGSGGLTWARFLDELAKDYAVTAPEHPGYGESSGLDALDDMTDFALYVGDFCDAVGIERAHVIGHSLGGMLAAEAAILQAEYVNKLVICNAIGFWRDETPVLDYIITPPEQLMAAAFHDLESPAVAEAFKAPETGEEMQQMLYERTKSFMAAGKFAWPIPDRGLKRRIHRIKAPTLIVWGEHDGLVPPVYVEDFQSGIKNSKVLIMKDVAHMPMYEDPDGFVGAVKDFLKD